MSASLSFANQWSPYAQQAGASLGIDPNIILGQWALESAYGTNTATTADNNPGSIMSSGSPVNYSSQQAFTNAYIGTIANDFPGAIGAGSNATTFSNGLASGVNGSYFGNEPASTYASGIMGAESNLSGTVTSGSIVQPTSNNATSTNANTNASGCGILNGGIFTWSCWSAIAADALMVTLGAGLIFAGFMSATKTSMPNANVMLPVE